MEVSTDAEVDAAVDCDGGCVLFADDFERPVNDVQGSWTELRGATAVSLAPGPPRPGRVLHANLPAANATTFREAFVSKTLSPGAGLRVELHLQYTAAGTFGGAPTDYCELASVTLGGERIVLLYYASPTKLDVWLYEPGEISGKGAQLGVEAPTWQHAALAIAWQEKTVTVDVDVAGVKRTLSGDLKAGLAGAVPAVHIGLRCHGQTGNMGMQADDVVVRALP